MSTKEEDFKQRLAGVMLDMTIADDEAARLLVGGLASRIVTHAGAPNWSTFNARVSRPDYTQLLQTFQRQGNEFAQRGQPDHVHTIEVLAVAMVARTQTQDPEVTSESARLDALIDETIDLFNRSQTVSPIIS